MTDFQDNIIQEIPKGFCQCGCGQKAKNKFCHGHNGRGAMNGNYKGGKFIAPSGYAFIRQPNHPRATNTGYVQEHILIAEKALGKYLPPNAVVHHAKGDKDNRGPLVICQDIAYHRLLHQRMKAFMVCGNANWRKCVFCKQYDDPCNLVISKVRVYHKNCNTNYEKERRAGLRR